MTDCGYSEADLTGHPVFFGGSQVANGHPYPAVKINETTEGGKCGFGGEKSVSISIEGELVCCDPSEKLATADSLASQFAEHCGDFSAGSYDYENCRVQSLDISQSHYRENVSYSISLLWVDPDYPDGEEGKVTDVTDSIQSSENDDSVTVTHTVSASASLSSADCDSCGCEMDGVQEFVRSRISENCPKPQTINLPNNKNATGIDCPEITEEQDASNCSFSITKTWTILKNLDLLSSGYGENIKVTQCRQSQFDENQKETITVSGNINWEAPVGCEEDCNASLSKVLSVLNSEISKAKSSNKGRKANVQKGWTDSFPPSANYSITFPPEPDDFGEEYKDNYSISISFGTDGIGSVSVSGSLVANQQAAKTSSENCLCEIVDAAFEGEQKYFGEAKKYYDIIKDKMGDTIKKLQGPCGEDNKLNPNAESSDENDCEGGSKSYSYSYTDKEEKDAQWNYSINVNKPIEKVSIKNTLGGGYCVHKTGEFEFGSVSVNGSRSQNCPGDPEFDTDGLALELASKATGTNNLEPESRCSETVNGDKEKNTFNKSFKYENGGGNAGAVNVLNRQNARRKF